MVKTRLNLQAMLTIPMTMYDDEQDDDSDDDDDVVVVERALSHLSAQPILPPLCGTTGGQTTSHNAPNTISHSALHTIILDCTVHKWYQCNMFLQRVKPVQESARDCILVECRVATVQIAVEEWKGGCVPGIAGGHTHAAHRWSKGRATKDCKL